MLEISNFNGDELPPLGSWSLREPEPVTEDWDAFLIEWSDFTAISNSETETLPDAIGTNTLATQQVDDHLLENDLADFAPMSTDYLDYPLYNSTLSFTSGLGTPQTYSYPSLNIISPDNSRTRPSTSNPRAMSQPSVSATSQPSHSPQSEIHNCNNCFKSFDKRHHLNRHMKLHTRPVACPVPECKHRTAKNRDMNRHVAAKHPEHDFARPLLATPTISCPVQGCRFVQEGVRRRDNLKRHFRNKHPGEIP